MTRFMLFIPVALILFTGVSVMSSEPGKQVPAVLVLKATGNQPPPNPEIRYQLFLPRGYQAQGPKWPLMLFLHGGGERGSDLELVKKHGPPKIVESSPDFPFVVASPQCPAQQRWNTGELIQLVDDLVARYRIDPKRVYVTGLSMGGYGTWSLCAAHPDRFAAAVPICGGGRTENAEKLAKIPLWVFHGAKDPIVRLQQSEEMVEAVKAAGGTIQFTVYPDVEHDSWTVTYRNQAVYDWLLSHRLP